MMQWLREHIIPRSITKKEAGDTGMAMVLICLLLGYFTGKAMYNTIAIPLLVLNMAFPMFYYPFAIVWLGLTNLLGMVVSKILLSVVYIVVLLPVGLVRRMMGKDSLALKQFKKGNDSVMINRDHQFSGNDIIHPY
jgi:NhaP-type Na+/H+ and K+/H+ antiporter